jgi:hypothetical protein
MHTMTQELKHRRRWEVIAKKMDIRGFYLDPVFMTSSEGGGIMIVIMGMAYHFFHEKDKNGHVGKVLYTRQDPDAPIGDIVIGPRWASEFWKTNKAVANDLCEIIQDDLNQMM